MSKLEKEIKILDIDVKETRKKLDAIGAEFIVERKQQIYTYDIPTIYHRYLEIKELLKSDNVLLINTALKKLQIILDEFADLVTDEILTKIYVEMNIKDFKDLLDMSPIDIVDTLEKSTTFNKEIAQKLINPYKWLRLRKNNDKVELTLKHIYEKDQSNIQKVKEYEINVSDINEANELLENMGIVKRNYQEKNRISYKYKTAEIEIDQWPLLEPYMEIECDDGDVIDEIVNKLELNDKEIVSLNTVQLYNRKNIDVLKMPELKF